MIGVIDVERARLLIDQLLRQVETGNIRAVILDVTGMPLVDTQIANLILQARSTKVWQVTLIYQCHRLLQRRCSWQAAQIYPQGNECLCHFGANPNQQDFGT
jgi:hypothetical protein